MVDLLDFPCSIIPNLKDIIGSKHVCLIGNKVDLLPVDDKSTQYTHRRIGKQMLQVMFENLRIHSIENLAMSSNRMTKRNNE